MCSGAISVGVCSCLKLVKDCICEDSCLRPQFSGLTPAWLYAQEALLVAFKGPYEVPGFKPKLLAYKALRAL